MNMDYLTIQRAFTRRTDFLWQLSIALGLSILSIPAPGAQVSVATRKAFENEGFIRFHIVREGDAGTAQAVDYFTRDDTATAGVHYLPVSGTARFAPRENTTVVDVPLVDNAQVDGERVFRLFLTNASADLQIYPNPNPHPGAPPDDCHLYHRGVIKDNELRPTLLDTSSAPDLSGFSAAMPDGRYLVWDTMLDSNGWVDASFVAGAGAFNGRFYAVHVFPDGKILGVYWPDTTSGVNRSYLVRLFPDGAVDSLLPEVGYNSGLRFLAAQTDGKILMARSARLYDGGALIHWKDTLFRLNPDGSHDSTFVEGAFDHEIGISLRPDGKILVFGRFERLNGNQVCGLIRLQADGSLDTSFASPLCRPETVFFRRNGKIIVQEWLPEVGPIFQLNEDGSVDPSFSVDAVDYLNSSWFEQSDGRIILNGEQPRRLNVDGTVDPTFEPLVEYPDPPSCWVAGGCSLVGPRSLQLPSGVLVFSASIGCHRGLTAIDGFPCKGFVRFLDGAPRPDFRPFTPTACYRSADVAMIQIVRTGDSSNAASVEYSTLDDTAQGGIDFQPQTGVLHFAPLEVSKTIAVRLLAKSPIANRLRFRVALSNPSAGYAVVEPIPVVIWPDLTLSTERLLIDNKVVLHGTTPGLWYALDTSPDLRNWTRNPSSRATAHSMEFDAGLRNDRMQFYRGRRE